MDPLSISASAAGLITICLQTIKLLKRTIETLRHAKQFLIDLLSQTERVRLFLEQLRGLAVRVVGAEGEGGAGGIVKLVTAFDENGVKSTLGELGEWVNEVVGSGGVGMAVRVLIGKGKAEGLLGRLRRHEEEILGVVMWICACVACFLFSRFYGGGFGGLVARPGSVKGSWLSGSGRMFE